MKVEEGIDEKLDELLIRSEQDLDVLTPLLARFARLSAASNAQIIGKYSTLVQEACRAWEDRSDKAEGIRMLCIGASNFYSAKFLDAIGPCEKALKILEDSVYTDLFGLANMIYGAAHRSMGKLDIAVKYLIRAGEVINLNGPLAVYKSYSNYQLAEINNYIQDYEAAEGHYKRAVEIAEETGETSALFRAYNGLANLQLSLKRYPEAKQYLDRSLDLEGLSDSQKSRSYCDLGIYHHAVEDYKSAIVELKRSYDLRMSNQLRDAASTSLLGLAKTHVAINEFEEALRLLLEANVIIKECKSKGKELQCYHLMAHVYSRLGEWQKSTEAFQTYDKMRVAHSIKQLQNIYKIKNEKIKSQKQTIENIYNEVQASIRYAKRIQQAILPPDHILNEHLPENFVLYKPKDIVSGDFYWLEPTDGPTLFAVADCTGHGVPGALVSIICNNALNRSVREFGLREPGEILTKVREIVIQEFEKSDEDVMDGMDIALCSLDGLKLKYAGAYNPLWIIRKGELNEIRGTKQPIGQCDNPIPFETHDIDLQAGDTFYISSDGYVDQFGGPKGKKFKSTNFKSLVLRLGNKSMDKQKVVVEETFNQWKGNLEQIDDVCVIGVRV